MNTLTWHNNRSQFYHLNTCKIRVRHNNVDERLFQIFLLIKGYADPNKRLHNCTVISENRNVYFFMSVKNCGFPHVSIYLALQNGSIQITISVRYTWREERVGQRLLSREEIYIKESFPRLWMIINMIFSRDSDLWPILYSYSFSSYEIRCI